MQGLQDFTGCKEVEDFVALKGIKMNKMNKKVKNTVYMKLY